MKHIILLILLIFTATNCSAIAKRNWNCKAENNKYGCTSIKDIDDDREKHSESDIEIKNAIVMGRTKEQLGKIYIAPYIDSKNHYHEGEYVRFVEESPDWNYQE